MSDQKSVPPTSSDPPPKQQPLDLSRAQTSPGTAPSTRQSGVFIPPPLDEGPPAYERSASEHLAVLEPPILSQRTVFSVSEPGAVGHVAESVVSLPGPNISRPGPPVSRSVSLSQAATGPTTGPPVPKRKDSLPSSQSTKRSQPGPVSSVRREGARRTPRVASYPGSSGSHKDKPSRKGAHKVPAMSASVESMQDEPHSTSTFEAHNLCRESFASLHEFFDNKQLTDVEVKVGNKRIACHRLVLACASRYFKTMFTSEMAESRSNEVTIQDIDENSLEQLITFAYTAKITLTTENVQSLLYASSILQIETVARACCEFMKTHLHPTNCIGVRNFAEIHGRSELMKRADSFARDHFMNVVDCEEFLSISPEHLETLVDSDDLNVDNETMVFEAVMKWVKYDLEKNKKHLPRLLSKVKLPLLPATYLVEKVCTEDLIKQDLECRDYLDEAKYYQMSLAQVLPDVKFSDRMIPRKSCAGVIFCVGGRGASGDPFKTIECYDLRKDRWFPVAEMSSRRRHVGVVSVKGKLYAVGGHDGTDHLCTGEVFDPLANKWKPIASMATQRRGIALACLGGPIYAVGGLDDSTCFNIVERYDPDCDSWSIVQAMNFPRGGVAVAVVKIRHEKGYMYAIGGNDGAASLESCERYDPHLNKWSLVSSMNKRRAGAGVAELSGHLYVIGGFDDNSPLDSVERYDPRADQWTMVSGMSCPRGGVGVDALGSKIYAVGGHDGTNYLSSVELYDPRNDSWNTIAQIGACRAGAGIAVVNCQIDDLKDTVKVNMSPAGTRRKAKKSNRVSCTVKCSIITHTSIIYNDDITNANIDPGSVNTPPTPRKTPNAANIRTDVQVCTNAMACDRGNANPPPSPGQAQGNRPGNANPTQSPGQARGNRPGNANPPRSPGQARGNRPGNAKPTQSSGQTRGSRSGASTSGPDPSRPGTSSSPGSKTRVVVGPVDCSTDHNANEPCCSATSDQLESRPAHQGGSTREKNGNTGAGNKNESRKNGSTKSL